MENKKYSISELMILDSQMKLKQVLRPYDHIYVGDEHIAQTLHLLDKYNFTYSTGRDPGLKVNTIIISSEE